ncbi:MAG: hypothetical protein QY327_05685 [Fimbriimonadaceae bacterium]|nr:MAG: hypothetical protein QY327_05685 [Fimbriimonadaceae bacterium]
MRRSAHSESSRLLILTLAAEQALRAEDFESLFAVLAEREKTIDALLKLPLDEETQTLVAQANEVAERVIASARESQSKLLESLSSGRRAALATRSYAGQKRNARRIEGAA